MATKLLFDHPRLPAFARKPPPMAVDECVDGPAVASGGGGLGLRRIPQNKIKEATTKGGGASLLICFCFALTGCASEMGRGSEKKMYTIADTMEVNRKDFGKSIQLRLDQKLFLNLENDPDKPGQWELVDYDRRILLLLSDSPRTASGFWGALLQARYLGSGSLKFRFTPANENENPKDFEFEILVRR